MDPFHHPTSFSSEKPPAGKGAPPPVTSSFPSTGGEPTLLVFQGNSLSQFPLKGKTRWTLGRPVPESKPDIGVSSPLLSPHQGEFYLSSGRWYYAGDGSAPTLRNGLSLSRGAGGQLLPVELKNGDLLRVGSPGPGGVSLLFFSSPQPGPWKRYILPTQRPTLIGRDGSRCQIHCPMSYISALHAKIVHKGGRFVLSDCGTRDGVWLNERKIRGDRPLSEGDRFSLCDLQFLFTGDSLVYLQPKTWGSSSTVGKEPPSTAGKPPLSSTVSFVKPSGFVPAPGTVPGTVPPPARGPAEPSSPFHRPILLQANIQSKKVPDHSGHGQKELVRDIRLEVRSGSLVAILGASGAGKSTVMNCLNGMDTQGVSGDIRFKGEDLIHNFDRLKPLIGSVSQEVVIHDVFTPQEEFREAALLRLPGDTGRREILSRVDETINLLRLDPVRKSRNRKLSGGEKKRVHIGIELVADRQLLCLDEPDASLDPAFKHELFEILRDLAHKRDKCIMLIIHDVSEMDLFDQVILMTKLKNVGRLAFSGTPAQAQEYFGCDIKDAFRLVQQDPARYVKE